MTAEQEGTLKPVSLRALGEADDIACVELSRAVGWVHRIEDWQLAIRLGRGVLALSGDVVVGSALWWRYGESCATLGLIIVSPRHQGMGVGKLMMRAVLAQTGERALMLNATAAGVPLYRAYGFLPRGAVAQHQGHVSADIGPTPACPLRLAGRADLPALALLDREASGMDRREMLAALLDCGACVVTERGGKLSGYSVIRSFGRGEVIGPVVAATETDATALVAYWLRVRKGAFVRVDIRNDCNLGPWLIQSGLARTGEAVTMARGYWPPSSGTARLFALANQALG